MCAKASIFRIGPFWPPRRTRALVDDGRALTLDEPAAIDEALALGDKLGEAANSETAESHHAVADDGLGRGRERVSRRAGRYALDDQRHPPARVHGQG